MAKCDWSYGCVARMRYKPVSPDRDSLMNLAFGLGRFSSGKDVMANTVQFDLLRWFSLVIILIITVVAVG